MSIRIAINGFGRIGRTLFRCLGDRPHIEVVAINDLADARTLSHLLKYDSIHGVCPNTISYSENAIMVDDLQIPLSHAAKPKDCPWHKYRPDFVIEATGKFKDQASLNAHLNAGAQKVIVSAPPESELIKTVVLGVNEQLLDGTETIISCASCTTNNAAPMIQLIDKYCGVEQAYITTVHSYTSDQSLHDQPHRDLRRARGAAQSIVPTTTGAAKALTKIFPSLATVIGGCGIRVPVANGSLTDITFNVKKECSIKTINTHFEKAAAGPLQNILAYTEDPIVSVDIIGNTHSCIFDASMTSVIGKMVKIIGWYDNETGYSSRILDLVHYISKK